ncbi:hypothetical protein ACQP00_29900 [Dactylosporangium sp. CS-047395]|uniref:hypothetical protein n=1 Tax=Dactylosporangium sp. CS-047395 TaxID=3239936 RepID=UPI003D89C93A
MTNPADGGSVDDDALENAFRRLGLDGDELELWLDSAAGEGLPQVARYRFLSALWPKMIDTWWDDTDQKRIGRRLLDAGADPAELILFARTVAFDTVFAMLYHLGGDGLDDGADLPSWALVATQPGEPPRGDVLAGLYEDLLSLDPSGEEGADIVLAHPVPRTNGN